MRVDAPRHKQTWFKDYFGRNVRVDEGVLHLLIVLKIHGVCSQFSCQGNTVRNAYFLANTNTLWGLLWRIVKSWAFQKYSPESKRFLRNLIHGYKEVRFNWIRKNSDPSVAFDNGGDAYYCIEPTYSKAFGFRTTFRWPPEETNTFFQMLMETKLPRN